MTDTTTDSASSSSSKPRGGWSTPRVPAPLQRLFDAVPLITYPPEQLPHRSPGASALPALHVFASERGAARGSPSYNPSCLKWQTYLRLSGIPHTLVPSTNHASPTGALPFLLPPLPADRHATSALPIPSSRLESYVLASSSSSQQQQQQQQQQPTTTTAAAAPPTTDQTLLLPLQSLLATPIRNAWLYTLYLSPPNTPLLRKWYIDPPSTSPLIRRTTLSRLRAAARLEIARSAAAPSSALVRPDPTAIYAQARRAFDALEVALRHSDNNNSTWFFGSPRPTLFDASVFSYTYLILHQDGEEEEGGGGGDDWGDDALRRMLVERCPRLVAHARAILERYWGDQEDGWVLLDERI